MRILSLLIAVLLKFNKSLSQFISINFIKFIKVLSTKLYEWTGDRWIIALSKKIGKPSKKEKKINLQKELLEKAKKNKIYKKVLEFFPDAELIDIESGEKKND